MAVEFLIVFISILIFYFANVKPRNFPPGPVRVPIIGNLLFVESKPHKTFMLMKNVYGNIFSLKLGRYNAIVLNNAIDIKDCFAMKESSGRPTYQSTTERFGGDPRGIFHNHGQRGKEQRQFAFKNLLKITSPEHIINREIAELQEYFNSVVGKSIEIQNRLSVATANVIWTIISDERFSHDDSNIQKLVSGVISHRAKSSNFEIAKFFPILNTIKNKIKRFYKSAEDLNPAVKMYSLINEKIQEHQNILDMQIESRDFIDSFLKEIIRCTDVKSSFYKDEGMQNLMFSVRDLFIGGMETVSFVMHWTFQLLAVHRPVQERVYAEIMNVIGLSRKPSLNDRQRMPYLEAVINEVLRFSGIVPLGEFHSATADFVFRGFRIPKGTIIIPNLYGAMHDAGVWGDPEVFRPERFLSFDESTLVEFEAFLPFATGRRSCVGKKLGQDELFLFLSGLLQQFKVEPGEGTNKREVEYFPGRTCVPKSRNLVFRRHNH